MSAQDAAIQLTWLGFGPGFFIWFTNQCSTWERATVNANSFLANLSSTTDKC